MCKFVSSTTARLDIHPVLSCRAEGGLLENAQAPSGLLRGTLASGLPPPATESYPSAQVNISTLLVELNIQTISDRWGHSGRPRSATNRPLHGDHLWMKTLKTNVAYPRQVYIRQTCRWPYFEEYLNDERGFSCITEFRANKWQCRQKKDTQADNTSYIPSHGS